MALISSNGTGGGNWSVAGTWVGGVPPAEGDCATIVVGDVVTIDNAAPANVIIGDDHVGAAYAITINGKLEYLSTAAIDHVFRCKGDLVIASGGTLEIGTVANPIPAARTFTIELNYSAALADGKYGLKNSGDIVLQGDPTRITVTNCLLNADAAVNATSLTTDVATGWKDNDDIAIASTTRTWTEAENGKMNGDAVGTALTVDGFGGVGGGLANAHSGTSPTQAEIINLTRNVKVTSFNTGFRGYVCCYLGSTSDVDYVEFYMLGAVAADKHGIVIKTSVLGATNFDFCGVWGLAAGNYSFVIYSNYSNVNNTVIYNIAKNFYISGSYHTITNNIVMKTGEKGFYVANALNTINNNTATSCASYGFHIYYFGKATSFNSNTAHSNNSYGIYLGRVEGGIFSSISSWRNNSTGIGFVHTTIDVDTIILFGNNNYNITVSATNMSIKDVIANGDSSFPTTYGIGLLGTTIGCKLIDCVFGEASGIKVAHTDSDVFFSTNYLTRGTGINCKFLSGIDVDNIENAYDGSYFECQDYGQTQYDDRAWYKFGKVFRDSTTKKTSSYSMRFNQFWAADDWLEYEVEIPVKDGESVVVSAWLRKNAAYTSANRPKIKISGMGITATEDQMSNVTDVWERVSVSGTPTRTGMAKLTIMTYLTNAGASAWCDFEKTGLTMPVLNTLEGSFWANGHFAQILFDTGSITAAEFWKTLTADIDKAGSYGNLFKDYIDALISSRASPSDILANITKKIPADLEDVPTDSELDAKHGGGLWEGTTPDAINTKLSAEHGVGSWLGTTPTAVAAAVWNALHGDYQLAGSMGEYLTKIYNAARKVFIPIRKR